MVKYPILQLFTSHPYGACFGKKTNDDIATVRAMLIDHRKAFDLIDIYILSEKLCVFNLSNYVVNWIIDFLSNRLQRNKLADVCLSEWGSVSSENKRIK